MDAEVDLRAAAELYERGFAEAPSDYYTGLNAVTTLRILTHHLGESPDLLDRARRLAPVAAFFAERAATSGVDAFWPLVSVAELALTRHLLDGEPGEPAVEEAYLRAALLGPTPDQARAVLDQLELYHRLGDAPALLERLEAASDHSSGAVADAEADGPILFGKCLRNCFRDGRADPPVSDENPRRIVPIATPLIQLVAAGQRRGELRAYPL